MTIEAPAPDILGASIKRVEDPRFITGSGNYVDDIKLASMAHMAVLRSPYDADGLAGRWQRGDPEQHQHAADARDGQRQVDR